MTPTTSTVMTAELDWRGVEEGDPQHEPSSRPTTFRVIDDNVDDAPIVCFKIIWPLGFRPKYWEVTGLRNVNKLTTNKLNWYLQESEYR